MLQEILNKYSDVLPNDIDVLIVGDGSGTTIDKPAAWSYAMFYPKDKNQLTKYGYGCVSNGTNNYAELAPYIHALYLDIASAMYFPRNVIIISDSEVTVKCGSGEYSRNANKILWASIDAVITLGYNIMWLWVPRNSNFYSEIADKIAKKVRSTIDKVDVASYYRVET